MISWWWLIIAIIGSPLVSMGLVLLYLYWLEKSYR